MGSYQRPTRHIGKLPMDRLERLRDDQAREDKHSKRNRCHRAETVAEIALKMKETAWLRFMEHDHWADKRKPKKYPSDEKRIRLAFQFFMTGTSKKTCYDWAAAANAYVKKEGKTDGLGAYLIKHGLTETSYIATGNFADRIDRAQAEKEERAAKRRANEATNSISDRPDDDNEDDADLDDINDEAERDQPETVTLLIKVSRALHHEIMRLKLNKKYSLIIEHTGKGLEGSKVERA